MANTIKLSDNYNLVCKIREAATKERWTGMAGFKQWAKKITMLHSVLGVMTIGLVLPLKTNKILTNSKKTLE